jgi:hypothetical protein
VLHLTNKDYSKNFIVTDYTKPTAINSTFINGRSFHPVHIFKGIIFGEAKRLRRLNETEEGYRMSLDNLKDKCKRSGFGKSIIKEVMEVVSEYKNVWNKETKLNKIDITNNQENFKKSIWATSLKGIIKLNRKEKSLVPDAQVVYARPPAISNMIINYKSLSNGIINTQKKIGSYKCGKCGLCGNHGKLKNMVVECSEVVRKDGYKIKIKDGVNCKDSGIYVGRCKICKDIYVGQTNNRFSQRWCGHRTTWKELVYKGKNNYNMNVENNDGCALFMHYIKCHEKAIWSGKNGVGMELSEAYEVVFVERVSGPRLDTAESFWMGNLRAGINVCRTFLPRVK